MTDYDRGFTNLTLETATTSAQRDVLESVAAQLGSVPPAAARMAHSPELFAAFQAGLAAFEHTSLTPLEREVVVLVLARDIECDVCVAIHTAIAAGLGARPLARTIVEGRVPEEPKLAALARFTEDLWARRGDVERGPWDAFLAAGYTRAQALEIVIGVGTYVTSTFANRLTGAHTRTRLSPGSPSAAAASGA
jgi:AhpD family alkylhydroperoxidase